MTHAPRALVTALALPLLAAAAGAEADLSWTGGVLGESVTYAMQGDPVEVYVLVPSFSPGPTPLAIFDPADPRLLGVGTELAPYWGVGFLDGGGAGSVAYPLPPIGALVGLPLYAQFVTAFGTTTLVDELSNVTSFALAFHGDSTFTVGNVVEENDGHSSTVLDDGRVLLAGGVLGNGVATNRLYLFDPQTQTFSLSSATMAQARTQHTATKLADGRVLLLGGTDEASNVFATGDLYDPTTDTSAPIASMSVQRVGHTATLLADGRVFVAGGTSDLDFSDLSLGAILALLGSVHSSTTLYNPGTNSWSAGPNLPSQRALMSASRLPNGKVLLTGGLQVDTVPFIGPVGASFINDCRLYNPATNGLENTGNFATGRALHAQRTLSNGTVIIAGGVNGDLLTQTFTPRAEVDVYSGASWTAKPSMASARVLGNVFEASGATVVAIGGVETFDLATFSGAPADDVETTGLTVPAWTTAGQMIYPRPLAIGALIDGGTRVLTTGGGDNGSGGTLPDLTAEIYVP